MNVHWSTLRCYSGGRTGGSAFRGDCARSVWGRRRAHARTGHANATQTRLWPTVTLVAAISFHSPRSQRPRGCGPSAAVTLRPESTARPRPSPNPGGPPRGNEAGFLRPWWRRSLLAARLGYSTSVSSSPPRQPRCGGRIRVSRHVACFAGLKPDHDEGPPPFPAGAT